MAQCNWKLVRLVDSVEGEVEHVTADILDGVNGWRAMLALRVTHRGRIWGATPVMEGDSVSTAAGSVRAVLSTTDGQPPMPPPWRL